MGGVRWVLERRAWVWLSQGQVVRWFWRAVEEFNVTERQRLLRFVTAVGRPPLNGFGYLQPPFTIRLVPFHAAPVCDVVVESWSWSWSWLCC